MSRVSLEDLKNYYQASFHLDFSSRKLDFSTPQVETIVKAGKNVSDEEARRIAKLKAANAAIEKAEKAKLVAEATKQR